jgi:hypothetical protein
MLRREVEGASFDDLAVSMAEGTITRGRAIKLAGAVLAGAVLGVFSPLAGEAEGQDLETERKRNKRRRRNRRERRRRRLFINRCKNNGRVVCPQGDRIACCNPVTGCEVPSLCNVL